MLKIEDNPPILHPAFEDLKEIQGQWWVARTKSRHEKVLAQAFLKWDIPYFLPLIEKVSKNKGRVQKSMLPLFGGYLFFCGNEEIHYRAMTTNRIAQNIRVLDHDGFIDDLVNIKLAISSGLAVETYSDLVTGKRCRVIAGPLMGIEGVVIKRKNLSRIIIQIDMLGQAASVEVDLALLESVED